MKQVTAAVLYPMDCEGDLLQAALTNKTETLFGSFLFSEGLLDGQAVVLARCRIGTANAAACTALLLEKYAPECVILTGTSGAHDPLLLKNDLVVARELVPLMNYVSPKRKAGEGSDPFAWQDFGVQVCAPDGKVSFVKSFACDPELLHVAEQAAQKDERVFFGRVGCGDVWDREADLIAHFHREKGTLCEAMEGLGVASVCFQNGVPMMEVRVISNSELREGESFSGETAQTSQAFVRRLLEKRKNESDRL